MSLEDDCKTAFKWDRRLVRLPEIDPLAIRASPFVDDASMLFMTMQQS